MEFFQKLGNVANKTCKYTTQQTNRLATITKLKWKMNEYKSKIEDLYEELGKIVYENNVREEMNDFEDRLNEHCKQIDELATKIETCRRKILRLNNKKQCANCYTEIYSVFNYCPNCGESQNSILKTKIEDQYENEEEVDEIDTNEQIDLDSYVDTEDINNYEANEVENKVEE